MTPARSAVARVAAACLACAGASLPAAGQENAGGDQVVALQVPYIAQGRDLCGGAAAAMVLRYWGRRDVYDTDFAHLVDARAEGIRTTDLVDELLRRDAVVLLPAGTVAAIDAAISASRPPIVLLEVRPGIYHYVVVVAHPAGGLLFHDPAEAPNRFVPLAEFERRWHAAGSWIAVVLADEEALPPAADETIVTDDAPDAAPIACREDLTTGIRLGNERRYDEARAALGRAAQACPDAAAPWRELAGLAFLEEDWREAERQAAIAVSLEPDDELAWQILASSRYVDDRPVAALEAWNAVGEPRVDLFAVTGSENIRQGVVERRTGLRRGQLLTPASLRLAERRLAALPAARAARIGYEPADDGTTTVTAALVTRSAPRPGLALLARASIEALAYRRLRLAIPSPTGGGDLLEGAWQFERGRPRLAISLSAADPIGIPAILRLGGEWVEETFAGNAATPFRDGVRRGSFSLDRWATARTRLSAGLAIERWDSRGDVDLVFSTGVEQRLAGEHGRVDLHAGYAIAPGNAKGYAVVRAGTRWRTTTRPHRPAVIGELNVNWTSDAAPPGVWQGAGTGRGRDYLLRAHPLVIDGVLAGPAFGRTLLHSTVEAQAFPFRLVALPVGFAAFVDYAEARRTTSATNAGHLLDAGLGIRIGIPGSASDLRLDWAHGLRDGAWALSGGWTREWN